MMVPLLALLVLSLAFHVSLVSPAALECARPRLRKEVRDLNATEWQALTTAANQLKRNGRMTQYTAVHQQYIQPAHGGALFMAWHRRFIWQFETELLAITGSALSGLPYFDPLMSYSIFDPTNPHFVGEATGCVRTGPMANWMSVDGACLGRALTQQPTYVDPRALTQLILTGQSFEAFGTAYEGGQHADVHNGIGGQMSSLQYAPDDLLFYMHHAHVDQVWWARQYANNMALYWDYQGTHTPGGVGQVTLNTPVPPWQDPVGAVVDTFRVMCTDYAPPRSMALPVALPALPSRVIRRDALDPPSASTQTSYRLFDFSRTAPLHRCVPLPEANLTRLGVTLERATAACEIVNRVIDQMEADMVTSKRALHEWPLLSEIDVRPGGAPPARPSNG